MTGLYMTFTRGNDLPREFVNTVGLFCGNGDNGSSLGGCILSGDTMGDDYVMQSCSFRNAGGILKIGSIDATELSCPAGEVLTGLHGRYGSYVDALGAICGPRPKVAILLPPVRPVPAEPVKVTHGDVARDAPIGQAGILTSPDAASPAQIPPDPIKPGTITPILIPGVIGMIDRCKIGYVWREASADDHVCVTPESRDRVRMENSVATSRIDPNGAYGPNSCVAGFVWREAYSSDLVCVTPEVRALVREENAVAAERKL